MSDKSVGLMPKYPVAYSLGQLVGREKEQAVICAAVQEGVQVVYIEGDGGIGKTYLLDESPHFLKSCLEPAPIFLNVVDFYDTTMHSSLALEEVLARQIKLIGKGAEVAGMESFLLALDQYRTGANLEQSVLHQAFVRAFNQWAENRWVILRFDTAEFLQYGQDESILMQGGEDWGEEASAITWLCTYLPQMEHVTALITARPRLTAGLQERLKAAYADNLWIYVPLNALSLEDTRTYFNSSSYGSQIDNVMIERIWLLTGGRPIMLSLAIDWLVRGIQVEEFYDVDIETLQEIKSQNPEKWRGYIERFEKALVTQFRYLDTPMDVAVYYAARARKGFTVQMLRKILRELSAEKYELTDQETQKLLQELSKLSFVKHPHGARENWFFLHDEMYDLLDRYVWNLDYPGYSHQAQTARFMAEQVYGEEEGTGLIADATRQLKAAGSHTELLEARHLLETLRTEQLFYWLEADPVYGYRLYDRLDTQALSQRRREWDELLSIEVLRFLHTLPRRARLAGLVEGSDAAKGSFKISESMKRDMLARWVHRFLASGDSKQSAWAAEQLLQQYPQWGGLWRARVLVGLGAARVRLGYHTAVEPLQEALEILAQPDLEGDIWNIRHNRATAYLYMGLEARGNWNVKRASEMYDKARAAFEENGELVGVARALNNRAYVVAVQGNHTQAIADAWQASRLRDGLGDVVGMSLSLNTLAIAEDWSGASARARRHAQEALSLLRRAQQMGRPGLERSISMVHLNLGRIRRHLARREALRPLHSVESDWQRAEEHLNQALEFEDSLEPYYRFDLYNQLGLLCSNWGNWIALRLPHERQKYRTLMVQSDVYFSQADRFTSENNLRVDQANNLEDWAWVFHLRRAYRELMADEEDDDDLEEEVFERLDKAEDLILDLIDPGAEGIQAHYIAGSIHHQWGRCYHKFRADVCEALRHYALSVAYYDQFTLEFVERRELVMDHIQNTFAELSAKQVKQMAEVMFDALDERHLKAYRLRRWLKDTVADVSRH
ncbi:MAG: ATP-binding protein [Anaerolineae bacterium]|nr:ATP-binding protein [Anaerolineae bacterium]